MTTDSIGGHDGPYAAPILVAEQRVLPEWIDYNGHMNVGYYGLAFDRAIDQLFDQQLGNGEAFVRAAEQGLFVLQSSIQFLRELKQGQSFSVRFQLFDHDHKRIHFWAEIQAEGQICATQEVLAMNVDHASKRATPFPDWLQARLTQMQADHNALARPAQLGAKIGIRRG
ncbi:thioesterase family protein [Pseudophaeobacter sp. EL27]|uniref:thioesterase family protein n=1 Tax=Pseudophaeobacter sp. EL27 TaxID=2107580 RepID=UPI000EFA8784|nr:thioesterase family protein [Pseudophaeobacter sp. EL27]